MPLSSVDPAAIVGASAISMPSGRTYGADIADISECDAPRSGCHGQCAHPAGAEAIEVRERVATGFAGVVAPCARAARRLTELAERLARADQPVAAGKRAGEACVGGAGPYNLMREVVAAFVEDERIQNVARGDI